MQPKFSIPDWAIRIRVKCRILLLSFAIIAVGCSQNSSADAPEGNAEIADAPIFPKIEIDVRGLKGGTCFFGGIYGQKNYTLDSLSASPDGKVLITRPEPYPGGLYFLVLPDRKTYVQFLLSDDQQFSLETDISDIAGKMKVMGSLDNQLFYENQRFERTYQAKLNELNNNLKSATPGSAEDNQLEAQKDELIAGRKAHVKQFSDQYPEVFFTKFKVAGQNPVSYPDSETLKTKDFQLLL